MNRVALAVAMALTAGAVYMGVRHLQAPPPVEPAEPAPVEPGAIPALPTPSPSPEPAPPERTPAAAIASLESGTDAALPFPGGAPRMGRVNLVLRENGWVRLGGQYASGESFSFAVRGGEMRGLVLSETRSLAWRAATMPDGTVFFTEAPLGTVACRGLPQPNSAPIESMTAAEERAPAPILSSRPGVAHVLYLDFDGETVNDPDWNFGRTIVAPKARMSPRSVKRVWERVAGDFAAFRVDVTTDASRYAGAAVGQRMRCIVTRNDVAARGAGGVAYIDSYSEAGDVFRGDIPCWVFIDRSVDACAEAISHELGHTLGLSHDGLNGPRRGREYYAGQGRGPTGWAPIMGVGYYKRLTQWSRGDYAFPSNTEDDLTLITRPKNGFGFAPDETGGGLAGAEPLAGLGPLVSTDGVILNDEDVDTYTFEFPGGTIAARAKPGEKEGNVDLQLELLDEGGTVLDSGNPSGALAASVRKRNLPPGTYYLRVRGAGKGDPERKGYPAYGSIGKYHIGGKVRGLLLSP